MTAEPLRARGLAVFERAGSWTGPQAVAPNTPRLYPSLSSRAGSQRDGVGQKGTAGCSTPIREGGGRGRRERGGEERGERGGETEREVGRERGRGDREGERRGEREGERLRGR